MSAMAAHRKTTTTATTAAWAVLIGMGGTSVTYNVYHAVHNGTLSVGLALLYGFAPVFGAALLSHIVAVYQGGRFLQAVTFVVMLGAMTLSIGATAAVVKPAAGPWMQWLFGAVLDAAALVALRVILSGHQHKAAEATALEAAERTAAEAAEKTEALQAQLAEVTAALETERNRKPPRNRNRKSTRNRGTRNTRKPAFAPAGTTAPEDAPDLDAEALILKYLAEGHSASQAGVMAGKSDSYGRQVARLARAAKMEPAGGERTEGDVT